VADAGFEVRGADVVAYRVGVVSGLEQAAGSTVATRTITAEPNLRVKARVVMVVGDPS